MSPDMTRIAELLSVTVRSGCHTHVDVRVRPNKLRQLCHRCIG